MKRFFISKNNKEWVLKSMALYPKADVVQVKVTSKSSSQNKRQKIANDEVDYISEESITDDSKAVFPSMYRSIGQLWFSAKGRRLVPSDKFVWKDSWFDGYFKKISVEQIIKTLTNSKPRKNKKNQRIMHIRNAFASDGKAYFTATTHTDQKEITLSSKISNLPTHGYYESYPRAFSKRQNDIVSYYETDSCAKKAMIV